MSRVHREHKGGVSPVFSCAQLPEVFRRPSEIYKVINLCLQAIRTSYLGTISLKSSILRRPAGVSPILMSMKTTGRVVLLLEVIVGDGGGKVIEETHGERVM